LTNDAEKQEKSKQIWEIMKAAEKMKPILVYFRKPKDLLSFQTKKVKDPEVLASLELEKDLWKRWVITELSKEFVCVRVNARKADRRLLAINRVGRAPVVQILDFNLKPIYFTASTRIRFEAFAKVMESCRKRVERAVKILARRNEETDIVKRAKARAGVLEQRELYGKGLKILEKRNWLRAERIFNKGIAIEQDSKWRTLCKSGLIEIKAGRALVEAEKLISARYFKAAKKALEKIINKYPEAVYFNSIARERWAYVHKKLN